MASALKVLIFLSVLTGTTLAAESWGYSGSTGPSHWGDLSADCDGTSQSPINIYEGDTAKEDYPAWFFNNYDVQTTGMVLSNNGHTAVVSVPSELNGTVTGAGLPGVYKAAQFHFHWGGTSALGSEHLINSHAYPMELHIVHLNMKYPDVATGLQNSDGLAVLGFMFEVSSSDNSNYRDLITKLESVVEKDTDATLASASLSSLLPAQFGDFYRYNGSLTTPNCQEVVTWTVFTASIKISEKQLDAFRLLQDSHAFHLIDNFRPVQPLGSRDVTVNFDSNLHWGYFGHVGVDHWSEYYSACGAQSQSPINIVTGEAEMTNFTSFDYTGYDTTNGITMEITNNGHSVKVDITAGSITISGGGLPEGFTLAQFHFHWGSDNLQGSEHLINGAKFPMELHLVHYKTSLGSLGDAVKVPGGLAVLGFMFEVDEVANTNMNAIVEKLMLIKSPDAKTNLTTIKLDDILPTNRNKFYRYSGSLTTPGCFESVIWTVFDESIPISNAQLEAFRQLQSSEHSETTNDVLMLVNNYRPPQPLNSRIVHRNFEPEDTAHWTYEGDHGASHWKDTYTICGGPAQSPINIVNTEVTLDRDMPSFTFHNYEITEGVRWSIQNNGHTIVVTMDNHHHYSITGGDLSGTYKLAQFHFHWGSTNDQGSEHTIDSKMYPMELHLVHYNADKYGSIGQALGHSDGLAVLGFMFEVTSVANEAYFHLVDKLSAVAQPKSKAAMLTQKLRGMIPPNTQHYYRYNGSLTTPGCNEVVTWTVFRDTIPISEIQLQEFRSILSSDKNPETNRYKPLVNNYRPVQPRNDRVIKANFVIGETDSASGVHALPFILLVVVAFVAKVLH